ncbi:MAG: SWIM zinc finger family protein, partial [Bacillota bacterium]
MNNSNLKFTKEILKNLANQQSFQKGINYYENNMVNNPIIDDNTIKAEVYGSHASTYEVEINIKNPLINHCTCPYDWGGVCKHIIALGLTWLNHKEKFRDLKEQKNNLKTELEEYFEVLNKNDLKNIIIELIQENKDIKFKILNYIQDKEEMTDTLYLEKIKNLKEQTLDIAYEFNQYGGGPREKENQFFNNIQEMMDFIDKETPVSLRREIIEDFINEYLKGNSGLDDSLLELTYHTANTEEEWELIVSQLQKSNISFDQEKVMEIHRDKLNNREKYLELRKENLEFGMDYYKLACYYNKNGQEEKAVATAL